MIFWVYGLRLNDYQRKQVEIVVNVPELRKSGYRIEYIRVNLIMRESGGEELLSLFNNVPEIVEQEHSVRSEAGLHPSMLALNILPVFHIGLLCQGQAVGLQSADAELHAVLRHHFRYLASYVIDEACR